MNFKVCALVGPTASGKSAAALELAKKVSGEIVNADSRQIYKYIPIGSTQPDAAAFKAAPHHLYGFLDPKESYNAEEYSKTARKIILEILARGKSAIVVGGTGFYVQALFDGLSPLPQSDKNTRAQLQKLLEEKGRQFLHDALAQVDPISAKTIPYQNSQRALRALEVYRISGKPISQWRQESKGEKFSVEPKFLGLSWNREELRERIRERTKKILTGILEESRWLKSHGYTLRDPGLSGLGYKHCFQFLEKNITKEKLFDLIYLDTVHYAKRQMTWFKKDPRINWLRAESLRNSIENLFTFNLK